MTLTQSNDTDAEGARASPQTVPLDTKFETALAELEQIVQSMEGGQLSLEESIACYRRGSELLKHCQRQLGEAEHRIEVLEDGVLRELDPSREE